MKVSKDTEYIYIHDNEGDVIRVYLQQAEELIEALAVVLDEEV